MRYAITAVIAAILITASASAERTEPRPASEQLWLARICVHELTWNTEHDCEPIHQVLTSAGNGRGMVRGLRRYSRRFWGGTSARPWARALAPGHALRGSPAAWPAAIWPDFAAFRERWQAVYEQAGAIVRGEVVTRCTERPDHWGSLDPALPDVHLAEERVRRGVWRRVDCGPTIQGYYARNR